MVSFFLILIMDILSYICLVFISYKIYTRNHVKFGNIKMSNKHQHLLSRNSQLSGVTVPAVISHIAYVNILS